MNNIDIKFKNLISEIRFLNNYELYYRIRSSFEKVNPQTRENMINFFNQFLYWGKIIVEIKKHKLNYIIA